MEQDKEVLHDSLPPTVSLDNLAKGAVYEMFDEAIKKVAANVADVNTDATQKRKITITISVNPYSDRSGSEIEARVETKLAGIRPAMGSMYFARRGGEHLAFSKDTKQTEIEFGMSPRELPDPSKRPQ